MSGQALNAELFTKMNFLFLRTLFLVALLGTLGSLYFSEVMRFPPCVLCWYQRMCLYPLVVIYGVALWKEDTNYRRYSVPFIAIGFSIAAYHNLVYYGFISEALTPCTQGVSCSSKQLELFGFLTIPLLSLLGFTSLAAIDFLETRIGRKTK